MRGKLLFLGGMAAGFVLGARAGREKYEELVVSARKVLDHPTVQEAAGVAQAQANRLYEEGKDKLGQTRLGEKLGYDSSHDSTFAGSGAAARSGSTGTATAALPKPSGPASNTNGTTV
ncbi:hypothetical protein [Micromonospora sp. NPDC049679]|uniref:hypothetical protein n=1 Tax=Micromonospora sp. NPDC049679 TaxID=3155920 RepID=UPI0033D684FA